MIINRIGILMNGIILTICIILTSCSSDSASDTNDSQDNLSEKYVYFISGKINGEDFIYGTEKGSNDFQYGISHGKSGVCTNDNKNFGGINYQSGVYDIINSLAIDFTFVRFYLCSNPQTKIEVFNDSFPLKSYQLSNSGDSISGDDGSIAIGYWADTTKDLYYTSFDGNTVNSSFKITKSTEQNVYLLNQVVDLYQEIEGTFSGTLYNPQDISDTVQITNGKFKLQVKLL